VFTSSLLGVASFNFHIVQDADAAGAFNGQDVFIVPVSWCALKGTNAAADNPIPIPSGYPDTVTDNTIDTILWRRHERATDGYQPPTQPYISGFQSQAGITFRSGIDKPTVFGGGGAVHFQKVDDPMFGGINGELGFVRAPPSQEVDLIINGCLTKWREVNQPRLGIFIINVRGFVDGQGNVLPTGAGVTINVRSSEPIHHKVIMVPDNLNTIGSGINDKADLILAHELGHALGLDCSINNAAPGCHSNDPRRLMFGGPQDNSPFDDIPDNSLLIQAEIDKVRSTASMITPHMMDPPGQTTNGNIQGTFEVDQIHEENVTSFLDLSVFPIELNTAENKVSLGQQLLGVIPRNTGLLQYWTLVDIDNNSGTGATPQMLQAIGLQQSNFQGAELIVRANVVIGRITGVVWQFTNGNLERLPADGFRFDLLENKLAHGEIPIYHTVSVTINNEFSNFALDRPFAIQAITGHVILCDPDNPCPPTFVPADKLDITSNEHGTVGGVSIPSFPTCSPQSDGVVGQTVEVQVEGLLPSSPIHGLLGPRQVFSGNTNSQGNAMIQFPIPSDANPGLHLVTIGVDNTALSADCVVNVSGGPPPGNITNIMWINHFDFLPGDPSITTSSNAISSGIGGGLTGLVIESSTTGETATGGGNKVVHRALEVPLGSIVKEVRVCYESTSNATYISQIRLSQVQDPPSSATVLLDDGTDLVNPGPICVNSNETSVDPSQGPTLLSLRLNFGNTADKIVVRGVGLILAPKS
jgi:hypothetical protein